ncbi:MAG: hypothetical protein EA422_00145, partial [Gemmatimonadales bacterium]
MTTPLRHTLRFAAGWIRPASDLRTRTLTLGPGRGAAGTAATSYPVPAADRGPATGLLLERGDGDGPRPGWVVLHGITRPGPRHPALLHFAGALASTGVRVLIPEIPEWRRMDLAPLRAQEIIGLAVDRLASDPETAPGGVVLLGFSFGSAQALYHLSDRAARGEPAPVRGVAGWGGYADLGRTVHFQFTGEHGWGDERYRVTPDPYGRWVVGANILPLVPGLTGSRPVAEALRRLAIRSSDLQMAGSSPSFDSVKMQLRVGLPRPLRPLFDLFAPRAGRIPPRDEAAEMTRRLVEAAEIHVPLLDPLPLIADVPVPVRLLHARSDQLIPFTETLAAARMLEGRTPGLESRILGLF